MLPVFICATVPCLVRKVQAQGLTANIDSERVGVCNECDSARQLSATLPNGYAGCERGGLSLDRFSYGRLFEFPAQLSHEFV